MPFAHHLSPRRLDSAFSAVFGCRIFVDSSNQDATVRRAKRLARKVRQFQPALACPWILLASSASLQIDTCGEKAGDTARIISIKSYTNHYISKTA